MRMNKYIAGLLVAFAALFGNVSASYACNQCECDYGEPESTVLTYDYLYDYGISSWVRVDSSVDYLPCYEASRLVDNLRTSGFNVSFYGYWDCPTQVTYSVFHDSFYVSGFNYHNHWSSHHYAFHHTSVKVYFHYNIRHNRRHHYAGYSTHYISKPYYKKSVVSKYRKWKRTSYKQVPVYYKNKKKVTYAHGRKKNKSHYKKTKTGKFSSNKFKSSPHKGKYGSGKGNGKRKYSSGKGKHNSNRGKYGSHKRKHRTTYRGNKGGKYKNNKRRSGGSHQRKRGHRGKRSRGGKR